MKKNLKKIMGLICAATVMLSAVSVNAAGGEYELNSQKPHPEVNIIQPEDGSKVSDSKYVYDDKLYYTTSFPGEDDNPETVYTVKVYEANRDGSSPKLISTQTIKGSQGYIELVTRNYVLVNSGYAYIDDELVIDKSSGQASKSEPYVHIGLTFKESMSAEPPTKHVGNYYLMQLAHSDVSPQKIIVFNGKNAKKTVIDKKSWDAKYYGKKIYYISDRKDGIYLGSCAFNGKKNKVITKLDVPKDYAYVGINKINKKGIKYTVMSQSGEKQYTYKF